MKREMKRRQECKKAAAASKKFLFRVTRGVKMDENLLRAMLCSCEYASYRRSLLRLKKRLGVPSGPLDAVSCGVSHTMGVCAGTEAGRERFMLLRGSSVSACGLPNLSIMEAATESMLCYT